MTIRKLAVPVVAVAVAFGAGGAFAALHGSSHAQQAKPAKVAKGTHISNVHYPCRHHDGGSALPPV